MSDNAELSISELRRKRAQTGGGPPPSAGPDPHARSASDSARTTGEPIIIEAPHRPNPGIQGSNQPVYVQPAPQSIPSGEETKPLPFDPWRLPTALKKRLYWLIGAGFCMCMLGVGAGYYRAKFFTRVTFTLRDLSARYVPSALEGEAYKPRQIAKQTMINFLNSAPLLRRVSLASTDTPITDRQLLSFLTVTPERDSDNVAVTISGKEVNSLVRLSNLYASNAVELSRETMSRDPLEECMRQSNSLAAIAATLNDLNTQMASFLKTNSVIDPVLQQNAIVKTFQDDRQKLDDLQFELKAVMGQLQSGPANTNTVSPEVLARAKAVADAEAELRKLTDKGLQDLHPDVQRARALIERRKKELADARKSASSSDPASFDSELVLKRDMLRQKIADYEVRVATNKFEVERISPLIVGYSEIKAHTESAQRAQRISQNRLEEAQQYLKGAEGFYDPPNTITYKDVDTHTRYKTMIMYGVLGGFFGVLLSTAIVLLIEITDSRLKTAADVKRVTQLPVLASLGNLDKMNDEARKAWAFRTWTILSGTLSKSANRGTVCGIISCSHGEGRTTWVELLVDAARQRGFEVTRLDFGKADKQMHNARGTENPPDDSMPPESQAAAESPVGSEAPGDAAAESSLVTASPERLKMMQAKAASVIHVQLPGLVWNLERRIQFQEELEKWQGVSSAVILVDLPPASVPEAILLAENLPQVLWLVDSGKSKAADTRLHLETLRHARCKLVGAVLNHEPVPLIKL